MTAPLAAADPGRASLALLLRIDEACLRFEAAWKTGQRPELESYLGSLAGTARAALLGELLAVELAYRQRAGEQPALADYRERFPDQAAVLEAVFKDVSASAPQGPGSAAGSLLPTLQFPAAGPTGAIERPRVGEYELLGVLGRGGMGVVFKARHLRLNRLAALKMILTGPRAAHVELARFQREAEAFASVQHPNVVQIYEIGEHEGLPYLALEFVEGGNLAQKLDGTPWPPRPAAELAQTLARAVQVIHSKGLIHRDLKPANVLLTPEGAPKVADFGLVKRLEAAPGQTDTGEVIGTPNYMAPEQARGDAKRVGPAADVYALGAILYELLTGRPPFKAATAVETVVQVLHQEVVPPRQLQPKIPRDLETICLNCLHKEPERRHATALALADDLGRFLAGESIRARPVGALERGWRWCRRKPLEAVLLLAVVVLLAGGSGGVLWQWRRAERQRAEAEESFRQAREAVDHYFLRISANPRLRQHDLEGLRKDLLQEAVRYYQALVQRRSDEPEIRAAQGVAYRRLAIITGETESMDAAIPLAEQARAIFERLARQYPNEPEHQKNLAAVYNQLGNYYQLTLRRGLDEEARLKGLEILEQLTQAYPHVAEYRAQLALNLHNMAHLYSARKRTTEAEAAYRRALALREQLVREEPDNPDHRSNLANSHHDLGDFYFYYGSRCEDAEPDYREARAMSQKLTQEHPANPTYRRDFATHTHDLGNLYRVLGRPAQALPLIQEALAIRQQLVAAHPSVIEYRTLLGTSHCGLGQLLTATGQSQAALDAFARAVATLEDVLRQDAWDATARNELRTCHIERAGALGRWGRHAEALPDWDRALELEDADSRERGRLQLSRAATLARLGKHARATAEAQAVVEKESGRHYAAASVHALAAAAVRQDTARPQTERERLAEEYAARAIALLAQAKAAGDFRGPGAVERLKQDPDFAALRPRADYQNLLRELEAKGP
jgi:serine/threonine-protein kinase